MNALKLLRIALVPAALAVLASACAQAPTIPNQLGGNENDVNSGGKDTSKKKPTQKEEPTNTPAPAGNTPPPSTPQADAPPTLASIAPDSVTVGQSPNGVELTLTGTRFAVGSQVSIGGQSMPANVISAEQIKVQVPADKVKTIGSVRISVVAKPGLESNAISFTVANPTSVTISQLVPANAVLGETNADINLSVTGSGFTQQSVVRFNGAALTTTFTSATNLRATIPSVAFIAAGKVSVTVATGTDVVSLPSPFEVRNPSPSATQIAPASVTVGDAATVVTITGSKFTRASEVIVNNTPLATTYVSATQLHATVPSTLISTARTLSLVVTTGAPGGGTSTAVSLTAKVGQSTNTTASCAYKCADYLFSEFECYHNWYCIGTGANKDCLAQIACTDTQTDTGSTGTTTTTAACDYKCDQYNYAAGECSNGWGCDYKNCLSPKTCGTGTTTTTTCNYYCKDYGLGAYDCSSNGGWMCESNGCIEQNATLCPSTTTTTTGNGGSACTYDCKDYNYTASMCTGGYYCDPTDLCLYSDATCN